MKQNILSNITSLKERPNALQFNVTFVDYLDNKEEFLFIGNTLSQCVTQCTALINYMFACKGAAVVYIFPTDCTTTYRNIYGRVNGSRGDYRMLLCKPDQQLTLADVRAYFIGY